MFCVMQMFCKDSNTCCSSDSKVHLNFGQHGYQHSAQHFAPLALFQIVGGMKLFVIKEIVGLGRGT